MPIGSVTILDETARQTLDRGRAVQETHRQRERIDALCQTLEHVIHTVEQSYQQFFSSQKEKIVRLSIDIAAKILNKAIGEGHYDIEKIVLEALESIPVSSQVIVRLNPADLSVLRQAVKNHTLDIPDTLQFIDDAGVGCAECIVESDQGVLDYLIAEHLKQIETVLVETPHPSETR
jgi:flagellar biosynthesis/type III secretory pathway protein FliH